MSHAQIRAMERFGIDLTADLARNWSVAIREGNAPRLGANPAARVGGVYALRHRGQWIPVVATERGGLITVLPARVLNNFRAAAGLVAGAAKGEAR